MKYLIPLFLLLVLFVVSCSPEPLPEEPLVNQSCADYTYNGVVTEYCASCGDGVCDSHEECTSSAVTCEDGNPPSCMSTADCGGLYCSGDCE